MRSELKYTISPIIHAQLSKKLSNVLNLDPHADKEGYWITSLYFDDFDDSALYANIEGQAFRSKFRIRYYNDDQKHLVLEEKLKHLNLGTKYSIRLAFVEVNALLKGDTHWLENRSEPLLVRFRKAIQTRQLRPKVIVRYKRKPYIYPVGNVRITLDQCLSTSWDCTNFLDHALFIPHNPEWGLMEVKYDGILPEFIGQLIQHPALIQSAHSKYVRCRLANAH